MEHVNRNDYKEFLVEDCTGATGQAKTDYGLCYRTRAGRRIPLVGTIQMAIDASQADVNAEPGIVLLGDAEILPGHQRPGDRPFRSISAEFRCL